uniref:Uncharacterized protein n=1 Tax=Arundo donax TaxID=35708 RepID=A0A0A9FV51_ARUDO
MILLGRATWTMMLLLANLRLSKETFCSFLPLLRV